MDLPSTGRCPGGADGLRAMRWVRASCWRRLCRADGPLAPPPRRRVVARDHDLLLRLFLYTIWLKRPPAPQTSSSAVRPRVSLPRVVWAAVTGQVRAAGSRACARIFFWTRRISGPLSLYRAGDYAKAGRADAAAVAPALAKPIAFAALHDRLWPVAVAPPFHSFLT